MTEQREAPSAAERPLVSVIVPVFNHAWALGACLLALDRQLYPRDRYEVIVVDNGSSDGSRALAESFPGIRLVVEPRPGSYSARNAGIAASRSEILAFTDADCRPAADWLARGVQALEDHPSVGLVGGCVNVVPSHPNRLSTLDLFSLLVLNQRDSFEHGRFFVTANLFARRSAVEQVGRFDASLYSGADMLLSWRVQAAGFGGLYEPRAVVLHPSNRSFGELCHRVARMIGGRVELRRRWGSAPRTRQLSYLVYYLTFLRRVCSEPRLRDWRACTRVGLAFLLVQAVAGWEVLRLLAGGRARR